MLHKLEDSDIFAKYVRTNKHYIHHPKFSDLRVRKYFWEYIFVAPYG